MEELKKIYEEVFIPAWKESHTEGEPPCFEEWKDNEFWEWLDTYFGNKPYEWEAMMIKQYAEDSLAPISICHEMETLDDYSFTEVYDRIDHENFNIRHDLYWENTCGYICSGDYYDYVDEYLDDYKEDILNHIIQHFDTFVKDGDIDIDEYEY